jgi:hypothetical protein
LSKVVDASDSLCPIFGAAQNGQEQRGKNSDDGDDHEQFNQCEYIVSA